MNRGFFRKNAAFLILILKMIDLCAIIFAGILAFYLRFQSFSLPSDYYLVIIISMIMSSWAFQLFGVYGIWRGHHFIDEFARILFIWGMISIFITILMFFTKSGQEFSRVWFGSWILLASLFLLLGRFLIRSFLSWLRKEGYNKRSIVILGCGGSGRRVLEKINQNPWSGLEVIGFFDDNVPKDQVIDGIPILGKIDQIVTFDPSVYDLPEIEQVWIALPASEYEKVEKISSFLLDTIYDVHYVPDIFSLMLLNHSSDEIAGVSVINLKSSPIYGVDGMVKKFEDYFVAIFGLIITLPIMLTIAVLIKIDSSGPILFKQRRWGLDGKEILVWKFRTMNVIEEDVEDIVQAVKNDSRVTRVGRFLRRTSLDELPQFFNVIQGQMSVVGPRPHPIALNDHYKDKVNKYVLRHFVKPGITGLAQVKGFRGETDTVDKMQSRIDYDIQYITEWSVWLDIKIIILTVFNGFKNKNAY